jgi:hypothetical protein
MSTGEEWRNAEVPVWVLLPSGELVSCKVEYSSDPALDQLSASEICSGTVPNQFHASGPALLVSKVPFSVTDKIRTLLDSAVIRVANDRGFVVEGTIARFVVASASRLPFSPTHYGAPAALSTKR